MLILENYRITSVVAPVGASPLVFPLRHEGQQGEFSPTKERLVLKWVLAPGFPSPNAKAHGATGCSVRSAEALLHHMNAGAPTAFGAISLAAVAANRTTGKIEITSTN
jgi:hypothetical protein